MESCGIVQPNAGDVAYIIERRTKREIDSALRDQSDTVRLGNKDSEVMLHFLNY